MARRRAFAFQLCAVRTPASLSVVVRRWPAKFAARLRPSVRRAAAEPGLSPGLPGSLRAPLVRRRAAAARVASAPRLRASEGKD